jgi:hypothetical protein
MCSCPTSHAAIVWPPRLGGREVSGGDSKILVWSGSFVEVRVLGAKALPGLPSVDDDDALERHSPFGGVFAEPCSSFLIDLVSLG